MSRSDDYRRHLKSPEWQEQRDSALARTGGFCQFCGDYAEQVHHVKYPKQFGHEHPHSLIPVCDRCHNIAHGIQQMEALTDVELKSELSPTGLSLKYLLSNGRVYASTKSWFTALKVPEGLRPHFETNVVLLAKMKKDLAGGKLEMSHLGTPVYRWHVIAEALRGFDRQWYAHGFSSRGRNEKREIDEFHDKYEQALANAINGKREATSPVSQQQLLEAMKEAVAPRLRAHDEKFHEHDVVIAEIVENVPAMRDQGDFITVQQAISEQGLHHSEMPLHPASKETLGGLAGQMLRKRNAEQGASAITRLEGASVISEVNTYRRREIYEVLKRNNLEQAPGASAEGADDLKLAFGKVHWANGDTPRVFGWLGNAPGRKRARRLRRLKVNPSVR
jgi:hypothetical protein